MDSGVEHHAGPWRDAADLGEELLRVLQSPLTSERLDLIEELVARREVVVEQIVAVAVEGDLPNELQTELQRLLEQQQVVEARMQEIIHLLHRDAAAAQGTNNSLKAFQRIMSPGAGSRLVNERR